MRSQLVLLPYWSVWGRTSRPLTACGSGPSSLWRNRVSHIFLVRPDHIPGVYSKLCFFSIHGNPSPACRRTTHPRKRSECTVTLIGWPFLYSQKQPSVGEGEAAKYRHFLEKNTIFNEHPVSKFRINVSSIFELLNQLRENMLGR